jgi:hypothetical protein
LGHSAAEYEQRCHPERQRCHPERRRGIFRDVIVARA